jgi:hypothetical protein
MGLSDQRRRYRRSPRPRTALHRHHRQPGGLSQAFNLIRAFNLGL